MRIQSFLAVLAILAATIVSAAPPFDVPATEKETGDRNLQEARSNPQVFVFGEQAFSKTDPGFDVVITSARGVDGKQENVQVRTGTIRVFRADASRDNFTQAGGWYWRCGNTQNKTQFKEPGALIMVVRGHDGTVQWYSLHVDFRC
jgi:hypothetical protein